VIVSHFGRRDGLSAADYIDRYAIPQEIFGHVSPTTIGNGGRLVTGKGEHVNGYAWIRVGDFAVHVDLQLPRGIGDEASAAQSVSEILADVASLLGA